MTDANSATDLGITAGSVLVGEPNVQSGRDNDAPGSAEAFRYIAAANGTLGSLSVYIDSGNAATAVKIGLYSDKAGNPGTLLTSGSIANPPAGAWSTVSVPNVSIVSGTPYWIAILSPAGNRQVNFRDVSSGAGTSQNSLQTTLTALPSTWSPGRFYHNSPMSAYGLVTTTPSSGDAGTSTADAGTIADAGSAADSSTQTGGDASVAAPCDQTLSPGADVAAAVSSAPVGTTICLNSGNYNTINLTNITRSGYVTIRSITARGASIAPQLHNTHYVRLQSLTISSDIFQMYCSSHVQWINNDFTGRGLTLSNDKCPDLDTLIDGNIFRSYQFPSGWYNGHIDVVYGSGVTISNNFIGGSTSTGSSDGIDVLGGASDISIGPGNIFSDILQSQCPNSHCDAIQLYGAGPRVTIHGNYFTNGDTFIMAPDGSDDVTVTDNVFDGTTENYDYKIQFGSANNVRYEHNTMRGAGAAFDSKPGNPASTNALVQNNIWISRSPVKTSGGSGCTGCTFTTNLFESSATTFGTNNLVGTPTFVGGASLTTLAAYKLTAGSLGYRAATDGLDMGKTY